MESVLMAIRKQRARLKNPLMLNTHLKANVYKIEGIEM